MQRLDFELNGGVTSTTIKVKDADGKEQDQEVRKQNIIKGRVVIGERDITIEREGDAFPAHVVAELVDGELVIAGKPAVPEGERPPAQLSVGAPLPKADETDAEKLAREKTEAEQAAATAAAEKSKAELDTHNAKVEAEHKREAERAAKHKR